MCGGAIQHQGFLGATVDTSQHGTGRTAGVRGRAREFSTSRHARLSPSEPRERSPPISPMPERKDSTMQGTDGRRRTAVSLMRWQRGQGKSSGGSGALDRRSAVRVEKWAMIRGGRIGISRRLAFGRDGNPTLASFDVILLLYSSPSPPSIHSPDRAVRLHRKSPSPAHSPTACGVTSHALRPSCFPRCGVTSSIPGSSRCWPKIVPGFRRLSTRRLPSSS